MTNEFVVIRKSLKVPKIKKILLYEMKFLVPNYSCLQKPWLGGYCPPDPRSLCRLSSTEFVEPPSLSRTKFLGTPLPSSSGNLSVKGLLHCYVRTHHTSFQSGYSFLLSSYGQHREAMWQSEGQNIT